MHTQEEERLGPIRVLPSPNRRPSRERRGYLPNPSPVRLMASAKVSLLFLLLPPLPCSRYLSLARFPSNPSPRKLGLRFPPPPFLFSCEYRHTHSKIFLLLLYQRIGMTPVPGAFDRTLPGYYGGVGGPPHMPLGLSGGYGAPLPLSGMRYAYGPLSSPGYGPLSAYGPPGPIGGYGYGPGPTMDRTTCNMKKCGGPRPASASSNRVNKDVADAPEGSWTCPKCNNLNYPFRNVCNRKGCGSEKPSTST
ncbi:hypothetical protein GW17_00001603 [Ensete ventricosum]|nr:hypothetical protein GW17_00001603 [Ensete ventricosum]